MNPLTRRKLITTGVGAAVGFAGYAAADRIAQRYGLLPPDEGGLYGPGETLTYAAQRLLTRHSMAREFSRRQISPRPVENAIAPLGDDFKRLQANGFADWKLAVDGVVSHPASFSLADIRRYPVHSQITQLSCEEGWSYIAEWTGTRLSDVLAEVGVAPQARYIVYRSIDPEWWESVDMADAMHPQTTLTYAFNGADLPVPSGGPLRLRVPRQLGYKSVKFINRITLTDNLKSLGKGLGSASPEAGYSWYAGI